MKYLLIPDKFKGSATAAQVVAALKKGILQADADALIHSLAASDGGDGFLDFIASFQVIERIETTTQNALQQPIRASFGFDAASKTAYVELAQASGLAGLKENPFAILTTSTFGTGIQIQQALGRGATTIVLGLGGSATNDGGMGIAHALGFRFLDKNHKHLTPCSGNLHLVEQILPPDHFNFEGVQFLVINDVTNPLLGPKGAVATYAPQKGATKKELPLLAQGLEHLAMLLDAPEKAISANTPGTGAAGGTAYGMAQLFDAKMISGAAFLKTHSPLENRIANASYDYIVTGEGSWDAQSMDGKVVETIRQIAVKYRTPVLVVCGSVAAELEQQLPEGIEKVLPLKTTNRTDAYCMENAARLITEEIALFLKQKISE
jgi:glycerate kinase